MSVIILLITVSFIMALLFLGLFIWSVKNGQMDDDFTPSLRILNDDSPNTGKDEHSNY